MNSLVRFVTTTDYDDDPHWKARAIFYEIPQNNSLWSELKAAWQVFRLARCEKAVVLTSSSGKFHPDLWTAILLGLLPRKKRPAVVLMGCMWNRDNSVAGRIQGWIVKLADRAVDLYAVQSSEEMQIFPQVWGISEAKMRLCLFFATALDEDLAIDSSQEGQYVFSGGNAHRDYSSLLTVAERLPHIQFVFATDYFKNRESLPPNVKAGRVPHQEFMGLMRGAAAVLIPLNKSLTRAAGQQTYLNAMLLGRPTLVTDALGVHDHIKDGETGFILEASVDDMVEKLAFVLDPTNAALVQDICQAGEKAVRQHYSFQHHTSRLLEIVDEALSLHS